MTVKVVVGDMFESKAQTLVNTVNTVGVMGKGIALGFKKRFPDMYEDYVERCARHQVRLGRPYLYKGRLWPWILNFPTKDHWRSLARLDAIVEGLRYLEQHSKEWEIESLAVPPLGCGEGGLEWRVVGPTLYRHLMQLDIPVELYAPFGTPHEELQPEYLAGSDVGADDDGGAPLSRIRAGWVALAEILRRIESQPYHWPVGRTSFQKIAYFATEAGIPTGLEYERGSYGPHSSDVKPMLSRLLNNGLIQERRLGQMFAIRVGPTLKDASKVFGSELARYEEAIARVADLFERLNTAHAEISATIHYSAKLLRDRLRRPPTEVEVLEAVKAWKQRRRPPLADDAIGDGIRWLAMLGWLDVEPSRELPVGDELFVAL
jgi:uncharacterized protein YwgA/O-acetyl-ADP-ribose deacetylase (regulator of RNase III)